MSTMSGLRMGVVGTGRITRLAIIDACKAVTGAIPVAVAGRNGERTRQFAERYGIAHVHSNATDLISSPDVQAVYVAVPPSVHAPYVMQAIDAQKPVLLEKPVCLNARVRDGIANAARIPWVQEALMFRHHPWQDFVRAVIAEVGAPRQLSLNLSFPLETGKLEALEARGGDVAHDLGPYLVQIAQLVAATWSPAIRIVRHVSTWTNNRLRVEFDVLMDVGERTQMAALLSYQRRFETALTLTFDDRVVRFPKLMRCMIGQVRMPYEVEFTKSSGNSTLRMAFDPDNFYSAQLEAFIRAVRSRAQGFEPGLFERQKILDVIRGN